MFIILICITLLIFVCWRIILKRRAHQIPEVIRNSFSVLQQLYSDINGLTISLAERKRLAIDDPALTYGEIASHEFARILEIVRPKSNEIFYDLGCGTGKTVFCAAMMYDWQSCIGVEILSDLYHCCLKLKEKFINLPDVRHSFPDKQFSIEFNHGNIFEIDFSDGDVVFTQATTLHPSEWDQLKAKLNNLKAGSRVIVVTKCLDENHFQLINEAVRKMSWGESTVRIYKKITPILSFPQKAGEGRTI
jgi:trans-aconitate methyltransferase